MKNFLQTFAIVSIIEFVFFFFGGAVLLDFSRNFWLAAVFCAFIISCVVFGFVKMSDKIDELENRIKELEEMKDA